MSKHKNIHKFEAGKRRRKWAKQLLNGPSIHEIAARMERMWVEGVKDGSCGVPPRKLQGVQKMHRDVYKEAYHYGEMSRKVA